MFAFLPTVDPSLSESGRARDLLVQKSGLNDWAEFKTTYGVSLLEPCYRALTAPTDSIMNYYFALRMASNDHANELLALLRSINEIKTDRIFFFAARDVAPPDYAFGDPCDEFEILSLLQSPTGPMIPDYLKGKGVNLASLWSGAHPSSHPEFTGKGTTFVDLEDGWNLEHPYYQSHNPRILYGCNHDDTSPHGTAVLGVVCGDAGIYGTAPLVSRVDLASVHGLGMPMAMLHLLWCKTRLPDVLLLEVDQGDFPVERDPIIYDLINEFVERGVTVIEPAGNANRKLDETSSGMVWQGGDSGAILVGCSNSDPDLHGYEALLSNSSTRIDCFAWGENVQTAKINSLGKPDTELDFNGTSAASAIVAGCALVLIGFARTHGRELKPAKVRELLSDKTDGRNTPANEHYVDTLGVMPNMKNIIDTLKSDWNL